MAIQDKRYSIGLEFCGHPTQKHVVRFCGDFIGKFDTREAAEVGAVSHAEKRGHNHTGWQLLADCEGVLWLCKGNAHRIAYGAQVRDFTLAGTAATEFGECLEHALCCAGKLDKLNTVEG